MHTEKERAYNIAYQRSYRRSEYGLSRRMYWKIQERVTRGRGQYRNRELAFTLEEFLRFLPTTNFPVLFKNWKESGYQKRLTPTVDRIENSKGYSLDNIQIITSSENSLKRCYVDYSWSKPVIQYDRESGAILKVWDSIKRAAQSVGITPPCVRRCCQGKKASAAGYFWKFA
jgi:hypothetical protein